MSSNNPMPALPSSSSSQPSAPLAEQPLPDSLGRTPPPDQALTPTHTPEPEPVPEHMQYPSDQQQRPARRTSHSQMLAPPNEPGQQQQPPQLEQADLGLGQERGQIQEGIVEHRTTTSPRHKRSRGPGPEHIAQGPRNNEHGYDPETRKDYEPHTGGRSLVSSQKESDLVQIAFPITETDTKANRLGVSMVGGPRRTARNTAVSSKHTSILSNARGVFIGRKGKATTLSRYSSGLIDHPPYINMIEDAVRHSGDKKGATRSSIKLFIRDKYSPKWDAFEDRFNDAVKRGVKDGVFKYTNNNNTRLAVMQLLATKTVKHNKALKSAQQPNQQAVATRILLPETIANAGGSHNLRSRSYQSRTASTGDHSVNTAGNTSKTSRRVRPRSDEAASSGALPLKKR